MNIGYFIFVLMKSSDDASGALLHDPCEVTVVDVGLLERPWGDQGRHGRARRFGPVLQVVNPIDCLKLSTTIVVLIAFDTDGESSNNRPLSMSKRITPLLCTTDLSRLQSLNPPSPLLDEIHRRRVEESHCLPSDALHKSRVTSLPHQRYNLRH